MARAKDRVLFKPSESLCNKCNNNSDGCNDLDFKAMPILRHYANANGLIVLYIIDCTQYNRKER